MRRAIFDNFIVVDGAVLELPRHRVGDVEPFTPDGGSYPRFLRRSVRVVRPVKKGVLICLTAGHVCTRAGQAGPQDWHVSDTRVLDCGRTHGVARYINAAQPDRGKPVNVEVRAKRWKGHDLFAFYAARALEAGEELRVDYGSEYEHWDYEEPPKEYTGNFSWADRIEDDVLQGDFPYRARVEVETDGVVYAAKVNEHNAGEYFCKIAGVSGLDSTADWPRERVHAATPAEPRKRWRSGDRVHVKQAGGGTFAGVTVDVWVKGWVAAKDRGAYTVEFENAGFPPAKATAKRMRTAYW